MRRFLTMSAVLLATVAWGCANPADDVTPAAVGDAMQDEVGRSRHRRRRTARAPVATGNALVISPENSKVEFTGSKVTGSHNGGFKAFTGTAELTEDGKQVRG